MEGAQHVVYPATTMMWLFMFMLPLDTSWPGWKYRKEERREGYYFILFLNKKDIRRLDSGYNWEIILFRHGYSDLFMHNRKSLN
jgi:hypothetical protein